MTCVLYFNTNTLHARADNEHGVYCLGCGDPHWPCTAVAIGVEIDDWSCRDIHFSLVDAVVHPDVLLDHMRAVHDGRARDSGRRLIRHGDVCIDFDYDADHPLHTPLEEPAPCTCGPGPSMDSWPGWITVTDAGAMDSEGLSAAPAHRPLGDGEHDTCAACGGTWPCASMIAGRDVDPLHRDDLLSYMVARDPEAYGLQAWHWSMIHRGVMTDSGWRDPCPEGAVIVFAIDFETELAMLDAAEAEATPAAPGGDDVQEADKELLRLLATRGHMHEEALALLTSNTVAVVRERMARLTRLGLVQPARRSSTDRGGSK